MTASDLGKFVSIRILVAERLAKRLPSFLQEMVSLPK